MSSSQFVSSISPSLLRTCRLVSSLLVSSSFLCRSFTSISSAESSDRAALTTRQHGLQSGVQFQWTSSVNYSERMSTATLPMVHDSHCKPSLHTVSLPSSQSCSANMPACNSRETTGRNSSMSLSVCGLFLVKQGHAVSASGCANATRQVQAGHSSTSCPIIIPSKHHSALPSALTSCSWFNIRLRQSAGCCSQCTRHTRSTAKVNRVGAHIPRQRRVSRAGGGPRRPTT